MARGAVIFDLDGTLTKPYLDFDAIRAETGVTGPILEAMASMDETRRREVETVLLRHEEEAATRVDLQPGVREVLDGCRRRGYGTAILTRNSRRSVATILRRFDLFVDALRTREDGAIKPSPEPIRSILRELHADADRSFMVGDYLFDIQSGCQAGTKTVLMIG
ncbi:MAG: HAD family hydrolase, partial [Planctomycetota bacterium]